MRHHKQIGTVAYMGGLMSLPEPFNWSWGNLLVNASETLCGPDEHIHPVKASVSLHDAARNQIVSQMRGDWLFMADTDMSFQPDALSRLVSVMTRFDLDVVTGIYSMKAPPHWPVLYLWNAETEKHEIIAGWDRNVPIFQVDSAGAGCLLVRRRAFEKIARELKENPFDRMGNRGEDHSFFMRLKQVGIEAWCAWNVEFEHLAYVGLSPSRDFKPNVEPTNFHNRLALSMAS